MKNEYAGPARIASVNEAHGGKSCIPSGIEMELRGFGDALGAMQSHEIAPSSTSPSSASQGSAGPKTADEPGANPRPGGGESVPAHLVATDRLELSAPADLLAICRRGLRAPWLLGRRMDDARTGAALPAVRHLRPRLRGRHAAGAGAVVPAVALWPLARHQHRSAAGLKR